MGNIVVGALIVIALLAAIFYMSTHGASGGCGGNCSGCGSFSSCHKPEKAEKKLLYDYLAAVMQELPEEPKARAHMLDAMERTVKDLEQRKNGKPA